MAYYPKSQITTNLYTNGDEYALITTKEAYEGYYYKLSTNKKYVGRNPNNGEGVELIPITPQPLATSTLTSQDNYIGTTENLFDINVKSKYYNNILTNIYPKFDDFERRILPSPYYPTPTDKERLIVPGAAPPASQFNQASEYSCCKEERLSCLRQFPQSTQVSQARWAGTSYEVEAGFGKTVFM